MSKTSIWKTTLLFVSWNVSEKGEINPIINYQPFNYNGIWHLRTFIKFEEIISMKLREGSVIHVEIKEKDDSKIIYSEGGFSEISFPLYCPYCHVLLENHHCKNFTWCPAFKNTSETVIKNTGYNFVLNEYNPNLSFWGLEGMYYACKNKNAIYVRTSKSKKDYCIVSDSIETIAEVGVSLGELQPGPHEFERKTKKEILEEVDDLIRKSHAFHSRFKTNK
jgi:hypothetical protein